MGISFDQSLQLIGLASPQYPAPSNWPKQRASLWRHHWLTSLSNNHLLRPATRAGSYRNEVEKCIVWLVSISYRQVLPCRDFSFIGSFARFKPC
jgi:hypothetical protein